MSNINKMVYYILEAIMSTPGTNPGIKDTTVVGNPATPATPPTQGSRPEVVAGSNGAAPQTPKINIPDQDNIANNTTNNQPS